MAVRVDQHNGNYTRPLLDLKRLGTYYESRMSAKLLTCFVCVGFLALSVLSLDRWMSTPIDPDFQRHLTALENSPKMTLAEAIRSYQDSQKLPEASPTKAQTVSQNSFPAAQQPTKPENESLPKPLGPAELKKKILEVAKIDRLHHEIHARVGEQRWESEVKPRFVEALYSNIVQDTGESFPSLEQVLNWLRANPDRARMFLERSAQDEGR